jgi:glycosyltransferase involved in cell wall biosynthesis
MLDHEEAIRVVRIISRLNIGGPAIQAITLTRLLEPRGYRTCLVRGLESPREGSMDYLAKELDVVPALVQSMRRDPGPSDLDALARLVSILRRKRPHIVHTHAAKAGTLGRLATLIAFPRSRPVLIHTFHGHSLTGYFSGPVSLMYKTVERQLASRTDTLLAVSNEVRDDLVRLGVAAPAKFMVLPLGFDLAPFFDDSDRRQRRAALRAEWAIGPDDEVVTLIARLVPIKRVDRFLRAAKKLAERPRTRFVVVGDGELHGQLTASDEARALGNRLVWAGFRRDMADVCFASDVVMLTSDNEGTPVSLIEAQAAAVPVVATDVGGVRSAVLQGQTGMLTASDDERQLASSAASILDDPGLARRMGEVGRMHTRSSYGIERLVEEHDQLYRRVLAAQVSPHSAVRRRPRCAG